MSCAVLVGAVRRGNERARVCVCMYVYKVIHRYPQACACGDVRDSVHPFRSLLRAKRHGILGFGDRSHPLSLSLPLSHAGVREVERFFARS